PGDRDNAAGGEAGCRRADTHEPGNCFSGRVSTAVCRQENAWSSKPGISKPRISKPGSGTGGTGAFGSSGKRGGHAKKNGKMDGQCRGGGGVGCERQRNSGDRQQQQAAAGRAWDVGDTGERE